MNNELDGFIETENDMSEEIVAYNYCLAEDYFYAFKYEDFNSIGVIDIYTFKQIVFWLNYDKEIGKDIIEEIVSLEKGSLITINNRTLIDAIYERHDSNLAFLFISLGVNDIKLYITYVLYGNKYEGFSILNYLFQNNKFDDEKCMKDLSEIINCITREFESKKTQEEKDRLLLQIKPSIKYYNMPSTYITSLDKY